jgi:hypothetical protein
LIAEGLAVSTAVATNVGVFRAEAADLASVYACDLAGYEWVLASETWRKLIPAKDAMLLKAITDGVFCGYLLAHEDGDCFKILRCSTVPRFRGRGVCHRLFSVLDGYPCEVTLQETNATGLLVAKRLGFRPVKLLRDHYEGVDGVLGGNHERVSKCNRAGWSDN